MQRDGTKLLYKAITNACIDRNHRDRVVLSLSGAGIDGVGSDTVVDAVQSGPLQIVIQKELEDAMEEGMAQLPVAQRAALELKSLGSTTNEIAEALGTSPSNAGVLVHRARKAWPIGWPLSWDRVPISRVENQPDEVIKALVRKSLEQSAERIDPRPVFARLQAAWPAPAAHEAGKRGWRKDRQPRRLGARSWAWGLSAAAAVMLLMPAWLFRPSLVLASPESLVREASSASAAARSVLPGRGAEGFGRLRRMFPDDLAGPVDQALDPRRSVLGRVGESRTALGLGPGRAEPCLVRLRASPCRPARAR